MKFSNRSAVSPFIVMDIMQEAIVLERQGRSIIHMEVGQPNLGAPIGPLNELHDKTLHDKLGYSVALGIYELRERISTLYKERYGLRIDTERIVITSGSSGAFILAFTAFFDAGDNILIGEPGYPSYKNIINSLSLISNLHQTKIEDRFQLTPEAIINSNASGVLVASPANPTGVSLSRNELEALTLSAKQKNMVFISDEIYHGLNFNKTDISALEFDNDAIIINSFSKYFSMTGWRLGWMIAPSQSIRTLEKLAQNLFICPSAASQYLGLFTLNSSTDFDKQVRKYKENKDKLMHHLPKIGFSNIVEPDGAFYIYAEISGFKKDSLVLVKEILYEAGVAITPGNDFDSLRGHNTVRFSFACSGEDVDEAIVRLTNWYQVYLNK